MRSHLLTASLTLALGALGVASCSSGGGGGGGAGGGAGGGGGVVSLTYYTTCGDPVCGAPDAGSGGSGGSVAACTTEKEGDACSQEGQQCDPGGDCHVYLLCAKSDPKASGCPISRARYKQAIDYVPDTRLQSLHDELMTMRLATWRYTSEGAGQKPHLGFIIDDNPESASVDATGDRVDLYGYTSMTVAAAQVQNKRIEAMERDIRALREELAARRACDR